MANKRFDADKLTTYLSTTQIDPIKFPWLKVQTFQSITNLATRLAFKANQFTQINWTKSSYSIADESSLS